MGWWETRRLDREARARIAAWRARTVAKMRAAEEAAKAKRQASARAMRGWRGCGKATRGMMIVRPPVGSGPGGKVSAEDEQGGGGETGSKLLALEQPPSATLPPILPTLTAQFEVGVFEVHRLTPACSPHIHPLSAVAHLVPCARSLGNSQVSGEIMEFDDQAFLRRLATLLDVDWSAMNATISLGEDGTAQTQASPLASLWGQRDAAGKSTVLVDAEIGFRNATRLVAGARLLKRRTTDGVFALSTALGVTLVGAPHVEVAATDDAAVARPDSVTHRHARAQTIDGQRGRQSGGPDQRDGRLSADGLLGVVPSIQERLPALPGICHTPGRPRPPAWALHTSHAPAAAPPMVTSLSFSSLHDGADGTDSAPVRAAPTGRSRSPSRQPIPGMPGRFRVQLQPSSRAAIGAAAAESSTSPGIQERIHLAMPPRLVSRASGSLGLGATGKLDDLLLGSTGVAALAPSVPPAFPAPVAGTGSARRALAFAEGESAADAAAPAIDKLPQEAMPPRRRTGAPVSRARRVSRDNATTSAARDLEVDGIQERLPKLSTVHRFAAARAAARGRAQAAANNSSPAGARPSGREASPSPPIASLASAMPPAAAAPSAAPSSTRSSAVASRASPSPVAPTSGAEATAGTAPSSAARTTEALSSAAGKPAAPQLAWAGPKTTAPAAEDQQGQVGPSSDTLQSSVIAGGGESVDGPTDATTHASFGAGVLDDTDSVSVIAGGGDSIDGQSDATTHASFGAGVLDDTDRSVSRTDSPRPERRPRRSNSKGRGASQNQSAVELPSTEAATPSAPIVLPAWVDRFAPPPVQAALGLQERLPRRASRGPSRRACNPAATTTQQSKGPPSPPPSPPSMLPMPSSPSRVLPKSSSHADMQASGSKGGSWGGSSAAAKDRPAAGSSFALVAAAASAGHRPLSLPCRVLPHKPDGSGVGGDGRDPAAQGGETKLERTWDDRPAREILMGWAREHTLVGAMSVFAFGEADGRLPTMPQAAQLLWCSAFGTLFLACVQLRYSWLGGSPPESVDGGSAVTVAWVSGSPAPRERLVGDAGHAVDLRVAFCTALACAPCLLASRWLFLAANRAAPASATPAPSTSLASSTSRISPLHASAWAIVLFCTAAVSFGALNISAVMDSRLVAHHAIRGWLYGLSIEWLLLEPTVLLLLALATLGLKWCTTFDDVPPAVIKPLPQPTVATRTRKKAASKQSSHPRKASRLARTSPPPQSPAQKDVAPPTAEPQQPRHGDVPRQAEAASSGGASALNLPTVAAAASAPAFPPEAQIEAATEGVHASVEPIRSGAIAEDVDDEREATSPRGAQSRTSVSDEAEAGGR